MNERIRELAHKADFINKRHNGDFWRWGYIDPELNFQLEKFAQLIVAECVEVAMRSVDDNEPKEAWYLIQEHFRVEE